jgi:hypothetical protein
VVGVAASGLREMICSTDGDIETPAGTVTVVDAVLDYRYEATTSTPPSSGQKKNVEHLAGTMPSRLLVSWLMSAHTSCIAPSTCGFQATNSLMMD